MNQANILRANKYKKSKTTRTIATEPRKKKNKSRKQQGTHDKLTKAVQNMHDEISLAVKNENGMQIRGEGQGKDKKKQSC